MPLNPLFGKEHRAILERLADEWWNAGPPVCFIEGFPGVGKTHGLLPHLRRRLASRQVAAVTVEVGDAGPGQFDDLLLELAQELALVGFDGMATALDRGGGSRQVATALHETFRHDVLIVLDEFQNGLTSSGEPTEELKRLLTGIGRRSEWPGRLLVLTNRDPHRGRWSDGHRFESVPSLDAADGEAFLEHLLKQVGREAEVPRERRADVVEWVGGNPRALQLLVAALLGCPLDELLGLAPEAWELKDRQIAGWLVEELERELLRKVLDQLDPAARELLISSSVLRRAVKGAEMDVFSEDPEPRRLRHTLASRFLVIHQRGWYELNPVAQEVGRSLLSAESGKLRRAHAVAGDLYARHFRAKRIVGGGRLGGYFVEARYHLVQAGREDELAALVEHFAAHLRSEITAGTPVPKDPRQLDERIAILSAFLETGGPKGMEYHLARCLTSRGRERDLERALKHARRSTGRHAPSTAWLLRLELEGQRRNAQTVREVLREALQQIAVESGASQLYVKGATLLAEEGDVDEALTLLQEGIRRVPPEYDLFSLYQLAGELLAKNDRADDAILLLREGIAKVPPEYNLFSLYQLAGQLLAKTGRTDEAILLLREGIAKVPPEYNVFSLYQLAGELLSRLGKITEQLTILKEGYERIPAKGGGYKLAEAALYNSMAAGRKDLLDDYLTFLAQKDPSSLALRLGGVLELQLQGEWGSAAELAHSLRSEFPRYLQFAIQEAYSWLCAGDAERAWEALESFPLQHAAGVPSTWLAGFVALRTGRSDEAAGLHGLYLGEPTPRLISERDLLRLWEAPIQLSTPRPSYYHPIVPPALSRQAHTLIRSPSGEITRSGNGTPYAGMATTGRRLAILAIGTEWFSRHGGLSTLNRRLCAHLAQADHRVVCLVPRATEVERRDAERSGVILVDSPSDDGSIVALGDPVAMPADFEPEVVIGHGRVTGPAAAAQVSGPFRTAVRVHVIHVAPGEIEWLKQGPEAAVRAEQREQQELELSRGADLVVPIGPRLARETGNLLASLPARPPIFRLDPGIMLGPEREPPPGLHILVVGRAEDLELKGLDIAAAAVAHLPHPHPRPFNAEPVLVVRGAPAGSGDELRQKLLEIAGKADLQVRVREYTDTVERIVEDLRRASLVLMPSRSEGFGLVGIEAIAAGVPVLVSSRSGLGELLIEQLGAVGAASLVVETTSRPDLLEEDAAAWARAIETELRDPAASFRRSRELLTPVAQRLDWRRTISSLSAALEAVVSTSRGRFASEGREGS